MPVLPFLRHDRTRKLAAPRRVVSWKTSKDDFLKICYSNMLQGFRESLRMLYRLLFLNHVEPLSSERH